MQPQEPQQQQRSRLQALTQQQLGRFRQVQATRELCDQDADLAARLARRWADNDVAQQADSDGDQGRGGGGGGGPDPPDADSALEDQEAALISRRRQLEDRLRRLADEADRLRRRCGNGEPVRGGDFTLARQMQDAESQLARVMSETEQADASLARCIAELDECRWRRRRSERHRRSRRRRHRRRQERHQRSRSVDAWVQTGRNEDGGSADAAVAAADDEDFFSGGVGSAIQQQQPGLPVVAPGSPIYDNPANSAPAAAAAASGHPLAFEPQPSRYAHTRQSLRQAVTASAAAAAPANPAGNGAAIERPQSRFSSHQASQPVSARGINGSTNFIQSVQQPVQRRAQQQHDEQQPKQRPISAYYFADSPLASSRQQPQLPVTQHRQSMMFSNASQSSTAFPQHPMMSSRNVAADLDPTYLTTDDLMLSGDVGYHLRRPQPPQPHMISTNAINQHQQHQHHHQPAAVPVASSASNFPAPVPGQRRSSASPVVLKSAASRKQQQQQQQQQFSSASSAAPSSNGNGASGRSRSQCAQS